MNQGNLRESGAASALAGPIRRPPGAQRVAPGIAQDSPLESLSMIMRDFSAQLGAEGSVLTIEGDDPEAGVLFSNASAEAERMLITGLDLDSDVADDQSDRRDIDWTEFQSGEERWSLLKLAIPMTGGRCFRVAALFRGGTARIERNALRVVKRTRPLLAGFLSLWSTRASLQHKIRGLKAALDLAAVGMILLDDQGRLLFANRAATALLDDGEAIRRSGASIAARGLAEAMRLQVAIDHVLARAPKGTRKTAPVVALGGDRDTRPLLACVSADETSGGAILHLYDPNQDVRPLIAPACRLYGLSPVEIRLTELLVGGACLSEASTAMRVKEQTARTYLKQIFSKTRVNRQADLVRLMLASAVPLADADVTSLV